MTVRQLYNLLDEYIPSSLSAEWDNDGLMCCPDREREVKKLLITLDVTSDAVDEAIRGGYDLIISHHPFIFKGLRAIDDGNFIAAKAMELIKKGISVFSFHTRLDALDGGVNDTLARLLGLKNIRPLGDSEGALGRIGSLSSAVEPEIFAETVRDALASPAVLLSSSGRAVREVAVVGGEGSDEIKSAIAKGADTLVSGRLGYHNMVDAGEMGTNLIEAGHFYTEFPVCTTLRSIVGSIDSAIIADIFNSNSIKLI